MFKPAFALIKSSSMLFFFLGTGVLIIGAVIIAVAIYYFQTISVRQTASLDAQISNLASELNSANSVLTDLQNQDQVKINLQLKEENKQIYETFRSSLTSYEDILEFKSKGEKTTDLDKLFASILKFLSDRNYASASATLTALGSQIKKIQETQIASFKIPENVKVATAPPSSGYSRQQVNTDIGNFLVDVVTADLNSTRVIVDTASDSDCHDNCPVLPLATYVSRNSAFAGINGSYFCPAEYPSCAGKTNSYDTLVMNKDKKFFNSDNNVFSTVPGVVFQGGSMNFLSATHQWGKDSGADSMIANHPLLVSGGQVVFGGGSDPKQGGKGSRSFVGSSGNTGYIGIVHNATVAEVARVLQAMGMQNALNLDSGGSTALWSGGYKSGPGRSLPNAILFVRK